MQLRVQIVLIFVLKTATLLSVPKGVYVFVMLLAVSVFVMFLCISVL